jgi:hypothetical protein
MTSKSLKVAILTILPKQKSRRNLLKITCHNEEFRMPTEWQFFATSHGKNACVGVDGNLKRLAAKASLQHPYNDQTMTPHQLYEWAQSSIHNFNFDFVTEN